MDIVMLVDLVLAVLAVEVVALAWARRGSTPSFGALLPNLGAGLCLVLAVRITALDGSIVAVAALLAAGGVCHVVDLVGRLRLPRR